MNKRYMKEHDAAEYTGISVNTLRYYRSIGIRFPYIKTGQGRILYDRNDLDEYFDSCKVTCGT